MGFMGFLSALLAVILSLALVLGLAWGAIWLLKKVQDRQLGIGLTDTDRNGIRFLRALPLGQRERVALIELDGERMLIGVTAGGISLLARWPKEDQGADVSAAFDNAAFDNKASQAT
jgi:flagellar protein FliO/FliZ